MADITVREGDHIPPRKFVDNGDGTYAEAIGVDIGTVTLDPTGIATEASLATLKDTVGTTTDNAVTTAVSGTLMGFIRAFKERVLAVLPTALGGHGGLVVEGVASGTPVVVSGTVTSTPSGTQAVSAVSLPLPTGAATQTTVASIDTKTPVLGQALAAASTPVVLPAAQASALAQESGGHLAAIDTTLAPATITGTLHADGNTVALALAGRGGAVFQILAASTPLTNAVTLEVDASFDGGTTWNEQLFFDISNNGDWLTGQIVGDQTFVGAYYPIALDSAATHVRVLQVGAGDFGAQIRLNAVAGSLAPPRSEGQNFNPKPGWTTQVGGRNASERLRPLLIGPNDGVSIEGVANMTPLRTKAELANKATSQVTVTNTGQLVLNANGNRKEAVLYNNGAVTAYLASTNPATVNDLPLPAGAAFTDYFSGDAFYAITAAGSTDLRMLEVA